MSAKGIPSVLRRAYILTTILQNIKTVVCILQMVVCVLIILITKHSALRLDVTINNTRNSYLGHTESSSTVVL